MFFWICFVLAFLPLVLIFPVKLIGRKNLKKQKGAVLAINHYSNLDAVLLDIKLKRKIYFLAKSELFEKKSSAFFLKKFGAIKINRGQADPTAIKESLRVLKKGKILGIFPEGTRNKTDSDSLQEVHNGAVIIAARAGVPIIPAIIYRRPRAFKKNIIAIGEPFMVESQIPKKPTPEEIEASVNKLVNQMEGLRSKLDLKLNKKLHS